MAQSQTEFQNGVKFSFEKQYEQVIKKYKVCSKRFIF
jgi:hypothetical protein